MVYVEDAIIVEVYETEPRFKVETVRPEVIREPKRRKKRQSKGLFDSLLNAFLDPFDMFDFSSIFDGNEEESETQTVTENNEVTKPLPENAIITDTDEKRIREIRFLYYEIAL